ncbi:hypothetical protein PSHT_10438 [Puccinia striiformis]|uniref:HAT C-terminal dimerisation domain-containing protein n=2 Tax=Puccinia striiformis TaxID=27350 RepID=A0A2S4V9Y4_9BASI|nr:hypothetical protein PSHT_10438 [Puccinia striiformis]
MRRPGFIPTETDSRRALVGNHNVPKPGRKQTATTEGTDEDDGDEVEEIASSDVIQVSKRTGRSVNVDLVQDSDEENEKAAGAKPPKDKTKDRDGFDHAKLYFYPPGEGPKQAPDSSAHACRWCPKEYMATDRSTYNLKTHRDGAIFKKSQRLPCPGRAKAIAAGASLPPTAASIISETSKEKAASSGTLIAYTTKVTPLVENQRLSSPSNIRLRPLLREPHVSYLGRLTSTSTIPSTAGTVIKLIKASDSQISLVSDVWTTKGSHVAFIGIACCYIDKGWKYVCKHLALKYISWHHNGKYLVAPFANTTDSGSNNFTMAKAVAAKFRAFDSTKWDVADNHHRCTCHVIALILGAGLRALQLSTKMVRPERSDKTFPTLETVTEEDEEEEEDDSEEIVEVIDEESHEEEVDPDHAEPALPEPGWEQDDADGDDDLESASSGIGFTLKKIDYISRRIASSPQKQSEWKLWAKKLGYQGRGLIGGYGIRWNIAYNSRQRAYEGRRVIKQLLENESDKYAGKSAADHFFKSYELTSKEWEDINNLNQVLKEFLELTKRFEGDGPKYLWSCSTMFDPMIKILKKYLNLALHCNTVLMATFLHPSWRMMLFINRFPDHLTRIIRLTSKKFIERETLLKSLEPETSPPMNTQSESNKTPDDSDSDAGEYNYYPVNNDSPLVNTEMERYNNGDFPMDRKGCVLGWWKAHCKDFPVMGSLARDYLACAPSSATIERTFSAAARVCPSGRSGLRIQTIERCISSHMWLRSSVRLGGNFTDCQAIIDAANKNPKFSRYQTKKVKKSRAIRD